MQYVENFVKARNQSQMLKIAKQWLLLFPFLTTTALYSTGVSADELLASYEPSETNLTVTSPDFGMTTVWPLQGGVGGVPAATEGSYVLKLDWTGETDRKVEVKHQWAGRTFDLLGFIEIQADVFIATSSALPGIVGIWDDVFGWTEGSPVPTVINQWVQVSMDVRHREDKNLDHIWAFLFENLSGDEGTIYIDNLRLISSRLISFAGYDWIVKSGDQLGPGPNFFSQSEDSVWVDTSGHLHLKIAKRNENWYCSEIIATESRGYGTYAFTVETCVDDFDENIVLGLFTWDGDAPEHNYREIDFEFSKWKNPANDNAQYVIQPWDTPGNRHRFDIDCSASPSVTTTHVMSWRPERIDFISYYGAFSPFPFIDDIIETWTYKGTDNPPPGGENVRMNFWLVDRLPPLDNQDAEIVISDFRYNAEGANIPAVGGAGLVVMALLLIGLGSIAVTVHRENSSRVLK